jgi:hypothetical protein
MESVYSNEQVLAYVVNETCSDSGKHAESLLTHGICVGHAYNVCV